MTPLVAFLNGCLLFFPRNPTAQPIPLKKVKVFCPDWWPRVCPPPAHLTHLLARCALFFDDISGRSLKRKFVPPRFPHVRHVVPLLPCGSLQLSCRHAPQGDHWDSRQRRWQGTEQRWTAEGGSSAAHSREITGLDTGQTNDKEKGTEARKKCIRAKINKKVKKKHLGQCDCRQHVQELKHKWNTRSL